MDDPAPTDAHPPHRQRAERLLSEVGGVATRAQLLAVMTRWDLETAVLDGSLHRLARGRYVGAGAVDDLEDARRAAVALSGVVSGLSAAQHWGWSIKRPPKRPVVTVPRDRSVRRPGVDVCRHDLPRGAANDQRVLTRVHTVVDCARRLPFDEALAVVDSALREGAVDAAALRAAVASYPRTGRARARRVLDAGDAGAANAFESITRAAALDVALLRPQAQVEMDGIGRCDIGDPGLKIAVECESWAFHSGDEPFRRDIRRYTAMTAAGWLVARFVWEDAMQRPDRIRDALTAMVRLRHTDTQFAEPLRRRGVWL